MQIQMRAPQEMEETKLKILQGYLVLITKVIIVETTERKCCLSNIQSQQNKFPLVDSVYWT